MKTNIPAETIALQALTYLASNGELLSRFMAISGISPSDFRKRATDSDFQAGILDFFLGNEADLLAFCEAQNIAPELPAKARLSLLGTTSGN